MDKKYIQDLYNQLGGEAKFGSFEDFQSLITTDKNYQKDFYNAFGESTLGSFQDFSSLVSINKTQPVAQKKKFALESSSEVGSSDLPKSPNVSEVNTSKPQETLKKEFNIGDLREQTNIVSRDATFVKAPRIDITKEEGDRRKKQKKAYELARVKEFNALKLEEKKAELEQQKEFEKANLGLRTKPEFISALNSVVNSNLTAKAEEDVISDLSKNFEKYGFTFEEYMPGKDAVLVRTKDGKKSTIIYFNNATQAANVDSANKLKDFISKNSIEIERPQTGDLLSNSLKAKNLRAVGRLNPDGSTSTVKFTSFEEDGKFKVIPTLFPKDPNNYSTNPNSWTELTFKEALKLARERGEVFEFKTNKEAQEFAKGSWKDVSPVDIEADEFYKKKGLDYMANKKAYEEYVKVRDMVDFIEETKDAKGFKGDLILNPEAKKYKNLIINGKFRPDIDNLLEKYKAQEKELRGQVFDAGFISDGRIQKTREEFDEYLDKRQNQVAKEAAQLNAKAKVQAQEAEIKSVDMFGLSVNDLMKYKPKNEQESINKNNIIKLYEDSKLTQSFAAKKYENAKTYFDAKVNKQIKGEYEDNWAAFTSSWLDAWDNGQAAEQILAFSLGIKDINSETDKDEAARIIVENLTNQSPNSSRAMARWQQASGFSEGLDAFLSNPFELMTTMAATSLSQILPYGMKIVPATTAAGAGTGAALGALGGPFAPATVSAGTVSGGIQGFRVGMSATSFAMEYTNAVLDVMKEKGYDITDPNQVEQALSKEEIWAEGRERGLKRGIPISVVDYLSAGLAGKVFKPTSAIASKGTKVGLQVAERAVFDPLAEATGELAAQATAGQEIDWKEISAEAMGGLGNNSSNMAINTYRNIKNNTDINIANNLTDINFLGTESASDERISTWANNMHQLGKIDADVNQRIQENVGLRRDAREALSVGTNKNTIKPSVLARTMELMSAKEELSSSTNRKELYADKIKAINEELKIIADTKELAPEDQSVDLSLTLGTTKKGISQYMINGIRYTKEQFLEKTRGMSARRILRSSISVKNDEEIGNELKQIVDEKIKSELTPEELSNLTNQIEDAVQEQSTTEVPVQSETGVSEQVEERVSEPKPEVATEPITQEEEVVTQTIIEALNEPSSIFVYDGKKGQLTTIGQTVVLETPTEIIDLGNVDELSDSTLADFGIQKEEELDFTLNEDNSVVINGKTYFNNYSNPEAAISQDKDGNYSVTLDTENGQKRTFRGQQADQIVYQMKLKNFEQNGTEQDIDAAIELADEAIRIEEEVRQPSTEREGKSVRKGKRKQRTLRQPKEPLTKAEREAVVPVQPAPKIDLGEDIARQVGLPPAPEGLDIVSEREAVAPAPTEPQVVSEQAVESKPTEKIKGGENLSGTFLNDKQLTFQESFDLANSELKEIEAQERTLSVQKEYEAKIREINSIKELAAKAAETELSYKETMDKIIKEVEATQKVVDDFNSKNNREYRGKSKNDLESELKEAKDKVFEAQQRISRAEDADAAIKEYNKAKEKVSEIEKQIKDLEDFNEVNSLIYDQVDASKKSDYEYKELFDKDPRLAAIQDYKDLIEFLEGRNDEENLESISRYKNYIKILEQDIKDNPLKKKSSNEISQLNKDADYYASEIENIQEEIAIEKSNTKEGLVELREKVKKEIEEVKKDKSLSRDEKIDKIEEIKYQIENFKEEQESIIEQYKNDLKDAKAELKKIEKKLAKLSGQNNINELLDLDTKKKDNLNRVLDFLNKIDDSLDMDPNELNDITRVMTVNTAKIIVKTLKTLVNASITLKEAIEKVAEIHSTTPDKIIEALDIVSKINENKSEGLSEMEAPGYNNLSKEIDNMISNDSTIDEVLDYVQSSDVYKNATDVQRELLVRDVRKRFGLRQKSAPSVAKLFGKIKDVTKITMTEKAALAKQLRDKARGARESIQEWKKQAKQLTEELDELVRTGKISVKQSSVILKKFAKVNIFSRKSVDRFTDYMVKVIKKADYANKLDKARNTLSSIKKLSKNADKNADLRAVGKEFSKIEPSMVEDIEEYNDIASKLETAIDGSKVRGQNTNIVDTVNIDEVYSYIEKTLAEQEEKLRQEKIDEIQDLYGVDASEFSAEEIDAMLEEDSDKASDNEKIVRATIKKAFDIYSSVIKEMLKTGVDPFTGEEVSFTEKEIDLIERFMGIDTDTIKDPKEVLRMVDSLINFIQNKSTAGMLKSIKDFEAIQGSESVVKKGTIAKRLRKYFSPYVGRVLGEKVTTLPVLFEKMFKGVTRAMSFEEAVGIADLINGASKAETEANKIVKEYIAKFYTKKANGESYNSAYNDVERGVFAHVNRSVIGTEARRKQVFEKRKQEVLNTIKLLETSTNDSEVQLAEVIKKVYDKILDGSENANDVRSKTDPENVNGVEFWISKWDSKFDALSDLAKDFYNKILGRDLGYTPDRVIKLQDKRGDMDLEDIQSQFLANTDEVLYDKKSGSLMDKQENRKIPKDMYIDFSFDKKNSNAMYDALTDLYTAPEIRKVGTFLKSDNFRKIFPSRKDANLVDKRIKKFVRIVRRKTPYSSSEISKAIKIADKVAKLGVTAALTSASQPFKQTIPVMVSTLINSGSLGMAINLDRGFNDWISNLGYAISNRGIESQAEIESINKLIERAAEKPAAQALKEIEKLQEKILQIMLVKPDVWIARASFKAYYEQYLKRQGLQSSNINYKTHQVNKEAADYAQRMIDRQQNISNHALAGDLYTSESNAAKILVKMLAPFSSFRLNQSARLGSDLSTLEYWNTSTKEDKIIALRSIAGYAAESATFRAIQIGTSVLLYNLAAAITGQNVDDEDEEKYINNLLKGAGMSAALDTFSPIPSADPFVQDFISSGVDVIESFSNIPEDEKLKLFGSQDQSALKIFGTYGIPAQRAKEIFELGKLAYTAKYKDRYGKEKEISQTKADELKKLIPIMIATSITGIASPDAASISRNAIRQAKTKGSSPEEIRKMREQVDLIQKMIDEATSPEEVEYAEAMLDRVKNPKKYQGEKDKLKAMKERLLVDEETGTVYENLTDLKRYNPDLYEKNFGEGSEYYELSKPKKKLDKLFREEERQAKDEEFGYVPKKKRRKNSDGTYKKYSSSSRSSSGSGSNSSSNSKYEYYDSRGIKTTVTRSSNRNSKYD